jgi:hypothetical protein
MSGTIIERRDHVLMTLWVPFSFWASTFFCRWSSTKGPFFRLRGISTSLSASCRSCGGGRSLVARPCACGCGLRGLPHGLTGWRPPEVLPSPPPCGWSTGFITTPRTVGRLPFHRMRPALPQLMFDCSALPTSPTVARQRTSTLRISPDGIRNWRSGLPWRRAGPEHRPSGRSWRRHRGAARRVHDGTDRDVAQRQVVAGLDVGVGAGLDPVALLQLVRRDDVALLAVSVVQQAMRRCGWGRTRCERPWRHAVLVGTTEVDHAVGPLVTATLVPGGDPTVVVAAALLGQRRTSDFSGVLRVISTKSATLEPRRPGVVGLYLRIPMSCSKMSFRNRCAYGARSADRTSEDVDACSPAATASRSRAWCRALRLPKPVRVRLALALAVHRC